MEAINVEAEYRRQVSATLNEGEVSLDRFIDLKVRAGIWVKDDGEYFDAAEWEVQYADASPSPEIIAAYRGETPKPTVTPEVRALITLARVVKRSGKSPIEKKLAESVYAALRSLDIEPDTL